MTSATICVHAVHCEQAVHVFEQAKEHAFAHIEQCPGWTFPPALISYFSAVVRSSLASKEYFGFENLSIMMINFVLRCKCTQSKYYIQHNHIRITMN